MLGLLNKINLEKADPHGMLSHIKNYPKMVDEGYALARAFSFPSYYIKTKRVLILGMGGSGIAGEVARCLLSDCPVPVDVIHDYSIPAYVDRDTLVIACSYSGDTEETIAGFFAAQEKSAKIIVITTGGKLKQLAEKFKIPCATFDYQSPPRASYIYSLMFILSVFDKLGFFKLSAEFIAAVKKDLENYLLKFDSDVQATSNQAKLLADKIFGKVAVIYSTTRLIAAAKRFKGEINENAKSFSFYEELPELNHNAILGISYPKNCCVVVLFESNFENERNLLRQNITAEILYKNRILTERIKFIGVQSHLSEVLIFNLFSDFVSFYLAVLNKVDPTPMSNIDYLKSRLT